MPKVSVLLPVFNGGHYLEAAVRSVLDQTLVDFEMLIVDDGSTDSSLQVLRSLQKLDGRISVVTRANEGLVATLNELVQMARGTYLARMDADDLCVAGRLASQCAYLDDHPDCVALGSRGMFIDPEGLPICEFVDNVVHEDIEAALFATGLGIVHPSVMMRTDAVVRIGGYRPAFPHAEDLDLFLRLGEVGRLHNLQEVLLQYRVHEASVSHSNTLAQSAAARDAVRAARARRGLPPVAEGELRGAFSESKAQLHRKWAWWALHAGNVRTARKHARLAFENEPSLTANFKLLVCVLRDTVRHLR